MPRCCRKRAASCSRPAALPELARRAAAGASGTLSLAFVSTADYSVLPPLLREFREAWPQVQIDLREATSDMQLEDLAQQRIDAGLLIPPLPERAGSSSTTCRC